MQSVANSRKPPQRLDLCCMSQPPTATECVTQEPTTHSAPQPVTCAMHSPYSATPALAVDSLLSICYNGGHRNYTAFGPMTIASRTCGVENQWLALPTRSPNDRSDPVSESALPTRPVSKSESLLRQKFYEDVAGWEALAQRLADQAPPTE